jgi:flagellar assembly protein FliH
VALIKNRHAVGLVTRGFEDLGDLQKQAAGIVEAARVEAQRIISEAQTQAAAIAAEAAPRGFAEGREQGLVEGRDEGCQVGREETIGKYTAELSALAASWTAAIEAFEADRIAALQTAREDIVGLSLAMGGRIARRVIEADPAVVQDQVAEAISLVTAPSGMILSINPDDRTLVQAVLPALCERLENGNNVELRDDPLVERGGCVLSTGKGVIDATIEKQIERIAEVLLPNSPAKRVRKKKS